MKYNQNRRLLCACYAAGLILLTGSTSLAAGLSAPEADTVQLQAEAVGETAADGAAWDFAEITAGIHEDTVAGIRAAAEKAHEDYTEKVEEERRKAEEEAAREAAAQAAAQTAAQEKELLAALIFCEAGNQPYEGPGGCRRRCNEPGEQRTVSGYDHGCDLPVRAVYAGHDRMA